MRINNYMKSFKPDETTGKSLDVQIRFFNDRDMVAHHDLAKWAAKELEKGKRVSLFRKPPRSTGHQLSGIPIVGEFRDETKFD